MGKQKKLLRTPRHGMDLAFLRSVKTNVEALLNARILDSQGRVIGELRHAEGNSIFEMESASAGSAVAAFAITELGHEDYFIARKLSNIRPVSSISTADVGTTDFKIAKTRIARRSIVADKPDGVPIAYTDTGSDHDNNREANDGGPDSPESQCVYPRYQTLTDLGFTTTVPMTENCVIYAEQVGSICGVFDDAGKVLEWLETQGRVWAKRRAP